MRPFRVVLEGSWYPERWSDMAGFFATRIVLAESVEQAADIATRRLLTDLPSELPDCPEPKISVDTISEANAEELLEKTTGFTFYSEPE